MIADKMPQLFFFNGIPLIWEEDFYQDLSVSFLHTETNLSLTFRKVYGISLLSSLTVFWPIRQETLFKGKTMGRLKHLNSVLQG